MAPGWKGRNGGFDCVGDDLALGVCIDKLEAAVGIHGWTNVESVLGTKIPRASGCRLGVDEDPTTNWTQWHLVEIKRPLKEFPSTDLRIQSGLPKKIEGKFSLWEKEIPKVGRKSGIDSCQDCQEVVLECVNDALHPITAMHFRGASWNLAFHLKVIASLYVELASLSRIWRSTERPWAARQVMIEL